MAKKPIKKSVKKAPAEKFIAVCEHCKSMYGPLPMNDLLTELAEYNDEDTWVIFAWASQIGKAIPPTSNTYTFEPKKK